MRRGSKGNGGARAGRRRPLRLNSLKRRDLGRKPRQGGSLCQGVGAYGKPDAACGKAAFRGVREMGPKREKPGNLSRANDLHHFPDQFKRQKQNNKPDLRNLHEPSTAKQQTTKKNYRSSPHSLPLPSNPKTTKKRTAKPTTSELPSNRLQPTRDKNFITSPPNHNRRVTASVLKGHQSYGQISSKNLKPLYPLDLGEITGRSQEPLEGLAGAWKAPESRF